MFRLWCDLLPPALRSGLLVLPQLAPVTVCCIHCSVVAGSMVLRRAGTAGAGRGGGVLETWSGASEGESEGEGAIEVLRGGGRTVSPPPPPPPPPAVPKKSRSAEENEGETG